MIIKGGKHEDERGTIKFVNDFSLKNVKRFYSIEHPDTKIVRAWQGHKKETKYFYVAKGEFLIGKIIIDDWEQPSKDLMVERVVLSENEPKVLVIESGCANGFKALKPNSLLIIYSDADLEQSNNDLYRFPEQYWSL